MAQSVAHLRFDGAKMTMPHLTRGAFLGEDQHMNIRPRMLGIGFAAIAAVGLLAGCGGGDSGSTGEPGKRPVDVPADAPFVDQNGLKFLPNTLTASVGETIYFHNAESAIHTVTINGTNESGNMRRDDVFEWAPSAPGTYKITCDLHPQMKATLTVP